MNDVPETELLSAYLDGELTAGEQVRVEQFLAASPEARHLLEELRALGSTLQGLPQAKLDEDLTARVLEVAERRMLLPDRLPDDVAVDQGAAHKPSAGRAAEALAGPAADSIGWLGIPWREISWRGMLSKRALVWTGIIVATAIIIRFTSPPPPKPIHDLARLDKAPAAAAPAAAGQERSKRPPSNGSWDVPTGQPRIQRPKEMVAKDERRDAADGTDRAARAEPGSVRPSENSEVARPRRLAADNQSADKLAEKGTESSGRRMSKTGPNELKGERGPAEVVRPAEKKAGPPIESLADSTPAPAAAPVPAAPARAAYKSSGARDLASAKRESGKAASDDVDLANRRVAKGGDATPLMNGTGSPANNANSSAAAATAGNWNRKGGQTPRNRFNGQNAVPATVVRLEVSALAAQNRVFENLLANNGLGSSQNSFYAAQNTPADNSNSRSGQAGQAAGGGNEGLTQQQNLAGDNSGLRGRAFQPKPSGSVAAGTLNQQASKPLRYEFDLSPEQLAIILKQIGERSDSFSVPEIEAGVSASPAQNSFAQSSGYGANNSFGGVGGGQSADRPGAQQVKAGAGGSQLAREVEKTQSQAAVAAAPASAAQTNQATPAGNDRGGLVQVPATAKQTASPAAGAARQHVVFILNVVDRVAPAASRAAPAPAKH